MKYIFFAACLFLTACNKQGNDPVNISGDWELRMVRSDMPTTMYPAGNNNIIVFTANTYSRYAGGVLLKTGTYTIIPDATFNALVVRPGEYTHRIVYDGNDNAQKIFIQLSGDKLDFVTGQFATDGGVQEEYQRKTSY